MWVVVRARAAIVRLARCKVESVLNINMSHPEMRTLPESHWNCLSRVCSCEAHFSVSFSPLLTIKLCVLWSLIGFMHAEELIIIIRNSYSAIMLLQRRVYCVYCVWVYTTILQEQSRRFTVASMWPSGIHCELSWCLLSVTCNCLSPEE